MLNAWGFPTLDDALLDPTIGSSEMAIPDLAQLPAVDWSTDDPLGVTDPSGEPWFSSANTESSEHEGYDWQKHHSRGLGSNETDINSSNSKQP